MNAQDIFDVVAEHLLRQNMRCMNPHTLLVTWKHQHLACSVGVLFPDDMDLELARHYATVRALVLHFKQMERFVPYVELLVALQQVHDSNPSLWWAQKLRDVAVRFGLAATVIPMKG